MTQHQFRRRAMTGVRVSACGLVLGISGAPVSTTEAYCITGGPFLDASAQTADAVVHVYLNAGPGCVRPIERTGLSADDAERLVEAALASFNEASVTTPRLVYGGRVCHETLMRVLPGQEQEDAEAAYKQAWAEAEPNKPLGITIQATVCEAMAGTGESIGGVAAMRSRDGFGEIVFKPLVDDTGSLCPRTDFYQSTGTHEQECGTDEPGVPGSPCEEDDEIACTCLDGDDGNPYSGKHECNEDLQFGPCLCRNRGYESYNLGDGQAHPVEPDRCDSLRATFTKDFMGVLVHELGHALGLGHTEQSGTPMPCLLASPDAGMTDGVMSSQAWVQQTGKARQLHLDDLLGLDATYQQLVETGWQREWQLVRYVSDDADGTWDGPFAVELPTTGAAVRPALSSATQSDTDGVLAYAVADADANLFVGTLRRVDGADVLDAVAAPQVPGASTRFAPAVARGSGRIAVAWIDQTTTSRRADVRWALRDEAPDATAWIGSDLQSEVGDVGRVIHKDIGLGYDEANDQFVLAVIRAIDSLPASGPNPDDAKPWIVRIDPGDASVLADVTVTQTDLVHRLGRPACHPDAPGAAVTHCAIPLATMVADGPPLGVFYTSFDPALAWDFLAPVQTTSVMSLAAVDLVADTSTLPLFMGSVTVPVQMGLDPDFRPFTVQAVAGDDRPMWGTVSLLPAVADIAEAVRPAWPIVLGSQLVSTASGASLVRNAWVVDATQPDGSEDTGVDETGTGDDGADADGTGGTGSGADDGGPGGGCDCSSTRPSKGFEWLVFAPWILLRARRRRYLRPSA